MQLPSYKNIYYTDFPQQFQSLINQLSLILNPAFKNIFQALNKNLTLADNLAVTVKDVSVMVNASGTPTTATSFAIDNSNTISGCQVILATNNTNSSVYPTGGIFISYTQSGSQININNITGLPANNQFTVRVVAYLT